MVYNPRQTSAATHMNSSREVTSNIDDMENATEIDGNASLVLSNTNEDAFWSKEQLVFLNHVPRNAFLIMGLIVSTIGIVGLVANGTVLFIFSRC